ncbi:MAG: zinc ribbon domain-containing protein [Euryarchaeota archaeon]|nr:zinc ribbon domain-containing protein [Euryarchaeota archaeon]
MPFCHECGKEVQDDWVSCPYCSTALVSFMSAMNLQDSVVSGDVNITQNIQDVTTSCNSCNSTNVIMMSCKADDCRTKFCELCHPMSRIIGLKEVRFDSGKGEGNFCNTCLSNEIMLAKKRLDESVKAALHKEKMEKESERQQKQIELDKQAKLEIEQHPKRIVDYEKRYDSVMNGSLMKIFLFMLKKPDGFSVMRDDLLVAMNPNQPWFDLEEEERNEMLMTDFHFLDKYTEMFEITEESFYFVDFCLIKPRGSGWSEGFVARPIDNCGKFYPDIDMNYCTLDYVKNCILDSRKIRMGWHSGGWKLEEMITSSMATYSPDEWMN